MVNIIRVRGVCCGIVTACHYFVIADTKMGLLFACVKVHIPQNNTGIFPYTGTVKTLDIAPVPKNRI